MKQFFRSPLTWICALIIALILNICAYRLVPYAFPLIHLDITMNLTQALEQADTIAQDNNFGPHPYQSAAQFYCDRTTTTFVELEGGGRAALDEMLSQQLYSPYTWQVRHFKEFEQNETTILFTPHGTPYGFVETISENLAGAQLEQDAAQTLAQEYAVKYWNIDFSQYELVEASKKREPSNRDDHTFVYERPDKQLGEGRYRLRIQVSGDKVTELTHFVKIPETFHRRYALMRSTNNTIAQIAMIIALLLFGGIVLMFFVRTKRVITWKQPVLWAVFLATMTVLASINNLPFLWIYYNTTAATSSFLLEYIITWIYTFLFQSCLLTGCFVAAETITRYAFGDHPQLWHIWNIPHAASYDIIARTLGGYLLAGLDAVFVVLFYFFARSFLGWWNPSDPLFDPNILATYVPWFSPLAQAVNAGFLEEMVFRAIPLAGFALIGKRWGNQKIWLIVGLIIQALIFGAVHANYAQQPAYARIVEMFIPALVWGMVYIRFGLLPVIITHIMYDVLWMALPIFISYAPYTLLYKCIIIACCLIPLFILVSARIKKGYWSELEPSAFNNASTKTVVTQEKHTTTPTSVQSVPLPAVKQKIVYLLATAGALAWLWATPFKHDSATIEHTKKEAIQQANEYLLHDKNIQLTQPWCTLPLLFGHYSKSSSTDLQHRFIWQQGGKDIYHSLLGTYLEPAHWTIRYAQFEGDIIKRAEEYRIMLGKHNILRDYHIIPESEAGASLTKQEAYAVALQALTDRFHYQPEQLQEISAQEIQLPARKDWLFTFTDPQYPLNTGQARVSVWVAGDTVMDATRFIHVPEQWERDDQKAQSTANSIHRLLMLMLFLLFTVGIIVNKQKLTTFSKKLFCSLFFFFFAMFIIDFINAWPTLSGSLSTSEPWSDQIMRVIARSIGAYIVYAALYAGALIFVNRNLCCEQTIDASYRKKILFGVAGGIFLTGATALLHVLLPSCCPLWPSYAPLSQYSPLIACVSGAITHYIYSAVAITLFFITINGLKHRWNISTVLIALLCIFLELSSSVIHPRYTIGSWLIMNISHGLVLFTLYQILIRFDQRLIIVISATVISLHAAQQMMFNAYPGALCASAITIITVMVLSLYWFKRISCGQNQ